MHNTLNQLSGIQKRSLLFFAKAESKAGKAIEKWNGKGSILDYLKYSRKTELGKIAICAAAEGQNYHKLADFYKAQHWWISLQEHIGHFPYYLLKEAREKVRAFSV